MGVIICATRGGEESYRTQDKAIELAKERGDTLLFLYVVDLQFLDKTAAPIVVDVENEVNHLGDFLLLMAKEKAAEQRVIADTVVRKGKIRKEIIKAVIEFDAVMVVMGRPSGEESAFKLEELESFTAEIRKETGAKTVIV
jgi:nucleotide-binding universal stress UspA family protein